MFFEKKTSLLSRQTAVMIKRKSSREIADIERHAPNSVSI